LEFRLSDDGDVACSAFLRDEQLNATLDSHRADTATGQAHGDVPPPVDRMAQLSECSEAGEATDCYQLFTRSVDC
jgi:hypothetical protein